jgi:hypothetical protein
MGRTGVETILNSRLVKDQTSPVKHALVVMVGGLTLVTSEHMLLATTLARPLFSHGLTALQRNRR